MTNQTRSSILANINPEIIDAVERYAYDIIVSAEPDTTRTTVEGIVKIEFPFDGAWYFPRKEAERLRSLLSDWDGAKRSALIGWLAIGFPLDWAQDWSRLPGVDMTPVISSLKDDIVKSFDDWISDSYRVELVHEYKPDELPFWPVEMEMQVRDNLNLDIDSEKELLMLLRSQGVGEGEIVLKLIVKAYLPAELVHKNVSVNMDALTIQWPSIAPDWQLEPHFITPDGNDKLKMISPKWRYDPDHRRVEFPERLQFYRNRQVPGTLLVEYLGEVWMVLRLPGSVVRQDDMTGSVRIRIENMLLSGREIAWLEASGQRNQRANKILRQNTHLDVNFVIKLKEHLRVRTNHTQRRWVFPGVVLTKDRLHDVASALRDMGYDITAEKMIPQASEPAGKKDTDTATQQEPPQGQVVATRLTTLQYRTPSQIYLTLELKQLAITNTSRQRTIPGDMLVSTEFETGDLVVSVDGKYTGLGSVMDVDLDRLMVILGERFEPVAELR
jgi:hypothetical protein